MSALKDECNLYTPVICRNVGRFTSYAQIWMTLCKLFTPAIYKTNVYLFYYETMAPYILNIPTIHRKDGRFISSETMALHILL